MNSRLLLMYLYQFLVQLRRTKPRFVLYKEAKTGRTVEPKVKGYLFMGGVFEK